MAPRRSTWCRATLRRRADGLPPAASTATKPPGRSASCAGRRAADHRPDRQRLAGRPRACLAAGMNDYLASRSNAPICSKSCSAGCPLGQPRLA
jgi:hypothetical protein